MKKVWIGILILMLAGGGYWLYSQASKPLPGHAVADQGRGHVDQKVWGTYKYSSNPPTSGPHDPVWTTKGIYSTSTVEIGRGHILHSLEHGYIEFHYNCGDDSSSQPFMSLEQDKKAMSDSGWNSTECKNLMTDLKQIIDEKTLWKMIMVPNPTINTKLAIAAWDRLDTMNPAGENGHISNAQKVEIEDFIDSFRDHGPEQTMEP